MSFISLVQRRYTQNTGKLASGVEILVSHVPTLEELTVVSLNCMLLEVAGPPGEISTACPNIQELDISETIIRNWAEVINIVSQLPALQFLDISKLRLNPDSVIENDQAIFRNLKSLVLAKISLPADKLQIVSQTFPNITSLVFRGNLFDSQMFAGSFNNLIKLNLSNCKIKNFEDLGILSSHDRLAELKLCNNPIETIKYSEGFVSLKKINVEGTLIEDLVTIFNFRSFPCLTEIRVGNTPISARLKNHFRKILVSYLSKATKINGGTVDAKERTLHERQFIRDFSDPKNSSEHVNSNEYLYKLVGFHLKPSEQEINSYVFRSLYSIQGAVYKFAEINLAPPTTAKLIFETEDGRKESKEVPLGWKVLNLKKLCQNLFGIPETQQKLFYLDSEVPALGMEILRFDNRALRTFKMKDNDVILVRVKD